MTFIRNNAVALAALFVALGGTATAATQLARDSVGAREIQRGAVRSSEIRNGSVGVSDLSRAARGERLTKARAAQLVEEVVTDPTLGLTIKVQGEKGEKGDAGAAGAQGPTGPAGAPGIAGVTVRDARSGDVAGGQSGGTTARCEAGEKVVGGGGEFEAGGQTAASMTASRPLADTEQGWSVAYANAGPAGGRVRAFAVCAQVGA